MKYTVLLSVLSFLIPIYANAQFAGGSGTEEDPYQVSTVEQLQEIRNYPDRHFIQINNIDASDTKFWNNNLGFKPIGDRTIVFSGSYNGNNYSIDSLYIKRDDERIGLFGAIDSSLISNVYLIDIYVEATGVSSAGSIAAEASNSKIFNVTVSGYISANGYTGGLLGYAYFSNIQNINVSAEIVGSRYAGGVVGFASREVRLQNSHFLGQVSGHLGQIGGIAGIFSGELSNCSVKATIEGPEDIGGIVGGYRTSNKINSCFAVINVISEKNAGGIAGTNFGTIENTYVIGQINGVSEVGGLAGINGSNGIIKNSYSLAVIEGVEDTGTIIGSNVGEISSTYWNTDSSQVYSATGRGTSQGALGLVSNQMIGDSAYINMSGLDFENYWVLTSNYPALYWENVESITPPDLDPPTQVSLLYPDSALTNVSTKGTLIWQSINANSFQLQVDSDSSFNNMNINVSNFTDTTYQIAEDELKYGGTYFWRVRAKNVLGYGEWSNTFSFTTEYALEEPEMYSPVQNSQHVMVPTRFEWYPTGDAHNYIFEISSTSDFETLVGNVTSVSNSKSREKAWRITTIIDSLDFNTKYYWRVKAENDSGYSNWSDTLSFTTESGLPETPTWSPENGAEDVSTSPVLTWGESRLADTYQIQVSESESFETPLVDVSDLTVTEHEVQDLNPNTQYNWRVRAHNSVGSSSWSEILVFTTGVSTSIESEAAMPTQFTLEQNFPNPFNPTTQIRYGIPEASNVVLKVYNMLGQEVATLINGEQPPGWHTASFDATGLTSGSYMFRLEAGDFVSTKKLMLIK